MTTLQQGDTIRHRTRGIGTIRKIERNASGNITRAWVVFRGDAVRIWLDDAAIIERGAAPVPEARLVASDGDLVA